MFTGIVEECGKINEISLTGNGGRIDIFCDNITSDMRIGDSISVNGICLTVTRFNPSGFSADVSSETYNRSDLKNLKRGSIVNLERAIRLSDRLGGHIVLGHVDGVGRVVKSNKLGECYVVEITYPSCLDRYIVEKGSISVSGISLTVASIIGQSAMRIAVIPHTYANTTLQALRVGDEVNLEVDIIARHLEKLNSYKDCEGNLGSLLTKMAGG